MINNSNRVMIKKEMMVMLWNLNMIRTLNKNNNFKVNQQLTK